LATGFAPINVVNATALRQDPTASAVPRGLASMELLGADDECVHQCTRRSIQNGASQFRRQQVLELVTQA